MYHIQRQASRKCEIQYMNVVSKAAISSHTPHTHTHMHPHMYTHMHPRTQIHVHTHMHPHTVTHTHTYMHTRTCTHTDIRTERLEVLILPVYLQAS